MIEHGQELLEVWNKIAIIAGMIAKIMGVVEDNYTRAYNKGTFVVPNDMPYLLLSTLTFQIPVKTF